MESSQTNLWVEREWYEELSGIDMELDSSFAAPQPIYVETAQSFASPLFEFSLKLTYNADCVMSNIWIEVTFGHHATGIGVDYGVDQINEWEFNQPWIWQLWYAEYVLLRRGKWREPRFQDR